jgi:iron complex transport system ATP-binding protein
MVLSAGRLVSQGAPAQALTDDVLGDVFRVAAYRADHQGATVIVPWAGI